MTHPRLERQSSESSPKYTTPLDKSVIWRLGESGPTIGRLAYINEQLQRHDLRTVPDYRGGRILINGKTSERNSGYTQFVGSILAVDDISGVSLLSTMPPVTTVDARLLSSVVKHWDDLELLEAEDGATLGLYWYRDQWVIRTASSFDASSITWDGRVTFGQMVEDVMKKYPQFRYDVLDKNKCYTFGIKHPAIHAYHEGRDYPIVRAWFIQSADIARVNTQFGIFNGSVQFDESIGLPLHQPANAATFFAMRTVPMHMDQQYADASNNPSIALRGVTLKTILDHTRGALGSIISRTDADGVNPAACHYGIILRSKKYTFFIPSDLYQYIASTCYTNELTDMLGNEQFNRNKFIVLFNALCPDRERKIFSCVYPQYDTMMRRIRDYLRNEFVVAMYAQYNKLHHNVAIDNIYSESTLDLARSLFITWARQYGLPKSPDRARIIGLFSDYVLEKRNARVLYHDVYAHIAEPTTSSSVPHLRSHNNANGSS